jgi:hypothetical protein
MGSLHKLLGSFGKNESRSGGKRLSPNLNDSANTRDISVLQLLTKLVKETDRLVRLADDIDTHASSPQAKAAFNLIGSEVNNILGIIKTSLEPLYRLYELDPGMRTLETNRRHTAAIDRDAPVAENQDSYDEQALWSDLKGK